MRFTLLSVLLVASAALPSNATAQQSCADFVKASQELTDEWASLASMTGEALQVAFDRDATAIERAHGRMTPVMNRIKTLTPRYNRLAAACELAAGGARSGRASPPAESGDIPSQVRADIMSKCRADWSTDFVMMKACVDQQTDAYKALNP